MNNEIEPSVAWGEPREACVVPVEMDSSRLRATVTAASVSSSFETLKPWLSDRPTVTQHPRELEVIENPSSPEGEALAKATHRSLRRWMSENEP